jgi:hypothetical protein
MSPNAGEGKVLLWSHPMSTAVHRSPNKLRRSNSIWPGLSNNAVRVSQHVVTTLNELSPLPPIGLKFWKYELQFLKTNVADPECSSWIPDPNFSITDLGSKRSRIRIRIKEFKYF